MRILVVGAGATGGYFGARLVQAGRDVTFLLRPGRAAQVREAGLRLTGQGPDETVPVEVVTADGLSASGPYNLVLLAVKNAGLSGAIEDLAAAVGPNTRIVPFLNGIGHMDRLNERFGTEAVLGGVVRVVTTLDAEGRIVRLASFADMIVGAQPADRGADHGPEKSTLPDIGKALTVDGFTLTQSSDILTDMWAKWVFIATLGAVTCLMRAPIGAIVAAPGGADFARAIVAEAAAVSAACGFPLPAHETANTTAMVTEAGSPLASSMYRDLLGGVPTESAEIVGDLVARAAEHGVSVPLLDVAALQLRVHDLRAAHR